MYMTLAAIYAALHVSKLKIGDLRVIMFGSGSACIADQIRDAIAVESGKSEEDAARQIYCFDKPGLLLQSYINQLTPAQHPYAKDDKEWKDGNNDLVDIIRKVKTHVLIGTSTKPKAFTKEVVQEMAKHGERPLIFPLSNPTTIRSGIDLMLGEKLGNKRNIWQHRAAAGRFAAQ